MKRSRSARHRRLVDGSWTVDARVARLAEPAVLVILAERPTHGYELLERLPGLLGAESVDAGNLYRLLRALEADGIVSSRWDAELPGPARRTYTISDAGRQLLSAWVEALEATRTRIDAFLDQSGGR
ncbi:MAG: PadR family transcriptional regulator [Gaiellaceae bacterium]